MISPACTFFARLTRCIVSPTLLRFASVFCFTLLAGCGTVPDASFLKRAYVAQEPEFKNAWGAVSERTNARLAAELKRQNGSLDIVGRQLAIEQAVVNTPLVVGNRTTLLLDGPATYRAMFTAMREARETINIEFYIIQDDEVGREFAAILTERRAAGVEVNLIYDAVGSFKTERAYFDRLKEAGVRVVAFHPISGALALKPWKLNHRDHRKQVIIDGRTVILGGINIDDVYAESSSQASRGSASGGSGGSGSSSAKDQKKSGWRDTAVQIDGPVVAEFQQLFLQTWEKQKGEPLNSPRYFPQVPPAGSDVVRAIGSTPDDKFSRSYLTFIAALTHAQKQVYITNAYFVPDPQLVRALIEAAQRGVDVQLVLPSTTDSRAAAYAAHSHYERLLRGGVKIYERKGALLHAKTAVVDGVWSRVGSSNLDWRSAVDNDELDAVIVSQTFASQMLRTFAFDAAESKPIQLEEWLNRPWRERWMEMLFRLGGRLL
jgi:cardiolipin synthase